MDTMSRRFWFGSAIARYQDRKGDRSAQQHWFLFFRSLLARAFSAWSAGRSQLSIVGTAAMPIMVWAIVLVVVVSRVRTVVLAVMPAIIGIPVESTVPTYVRA